MTDRTVETSPQIYARLCGVLYLIVIVIGIFTELFVRDKLTVSGDAAATANNIMASQLLWRSSIAGDVILLVCAVTQALLFYVLLRPVNRNLALLCGVFQLSRMRYRRRQQTKSYCGIVSIGGRGLT
jgi:membrane-anchored glycerophosphoryl diester phosphodiesterase (GDPDase)